MFIADLIAEDLLFSKGYVEELARRAPSLYRKMVLGGRRIDAPAPELKLVQCWIADFLRNEFGDLPEYVSAYEYNSSIVKNAGMHSSHDHIALLDIRHFFRSCTAAEATKVFAQTFSRLDVKGRKGKIGEEDIDLLVSLTCYEGALTMGSPSSPVIANRIMLPFDRKIIDSLPEGCSYSRYSDDIAISSNEWIDIDRVNGAIEGIFQGSPFQLNQKKTRCFGKSGSRRVTGVYINENGLLSIGAKRKRELKRDLYKVLMGDADNVDELLGLLAFCKQVDLDYYNGLLAKYSNYGVAAIYGGVYPALIAIRDKRCR